MVELNEIVDVLKSLPNDILLTPYGNHNGRGALCPSPVAKNDYDRNAGLFDLKRINEAVQEIPECFAMQNNFNRQMSSYNMKHILERKTSYIANGDFIMAMMLCGYKHKFPKFHGDGSVNCVFNAKVI